MTTTGNQRRSIFNLLLLLIFITLVRKVKSFAINLPVDKSYFKECDDDLEKKFIPENSKCPHSGFFPVKGSCTAYIPCLSFGGDLTKPIKRLECSSGRSFDISYRNCTLVPRVETCLQQKCYPSETSLENMRLVSPGGEDSKGISMNNTYADDVDEITVDIIQAPFKNTSYKNENEAAGLQRRNCSNLVASTEVAYRGQFKFVGFVCLFQLFVNSPFI